MPWLFFFSGLAIPAFYAVGLLAGTDTHLTVAEFWRFWVVHLWVEDFLELFTTVMVAYIFVMLGVVRETIALGVIFLDVILYSAGGVIGTMHHLYFSGTPVEHMALGAFFSAAEVIPLTFLTVEAWAFLQLGARQEKRSVGGPVPAPLGRHVPGRGRLLELPRRRHLRLPDQPADRVLLRDRHGADGEPRPRRDDGRLRDARRRAVHVRVALPDPRGQMAGEAGADLLLVAEHRARLDGVRHPAAAGRAPAVRVGERGLLRGAVVGLRDESREPASGVGPDARRRDLHRRRLACRSCGSPGWGCGTRGAVRRPTNCLRTCCSSRSSRAAANSPRTR